MIHNSNILNAGISTMWLCINVTTGHHLWVGVGVKLAKNIDVGVSAEMWSGVCGMMFGCSLRHFWEGHFFGQFEVLKKSSICLILNIIATIMSQQYIMKLSSIYTLCVQVLKQSFYSQYQNNSYHSWSLTIEHDIPLK